MVASPLPAGEFPTVSAWIPTALSPADILPLVTILPPLTLIVTFPALSAENPAPIKPAEFVLIELKALACIAISSVRNWRLPV